MSDPDDLMMCTCCGEMTDDPIPERKRMPIRAYMVLLENWRCRYCLDLADMEARDGAPENC